MTDTQTLQTSELLHEHTDHFRLLVKIQTSTSRAKRSSSCSIRGALTVCENAGKKESRAVTRPAAKGRNHGGACMLVFAPPTKAALAFSCVE
jgi:hypothetical protein